MPRIGITQTPSGPHSSPSTTSSTASRRRLRRRWSALSALDRRGAGFITRQHAGLPGAVVTTLRAVGRMETGHVAEHRVQVRDAQGGLHLLRRISKRPSIRRSILGISDAALFGFCLALVAYKMLAMVMAALRRVHGDALDQDLSLYYVAHDIAQTYHGMMLAIPEEAWHVFRRMCPAELVATLRTFAQKVHLTAYRKSPRWPKKHRPKRETVTKGPHVSTAKLLR